jgi:DNA repair exonuclease SbcCD ATPase subunit
MIIFNTIKWKNFLSTGNQFTEIELDKNQSTLIQGSNGAGKSTILDALCFVLFNKPFRKINKPQLVNSINEKDCVVQIEFTIGGVVWNVIRGIKPNKFEIYKNDVLVDQTAAAVDQQKWLEQNVLKMNYKAFTQVVILGSSTFVPFMQLTPANRREVIEDILDIQIFSTMNILLKDRVRQLEEQKKECSYELKSAEEKVKMQEEYIRNSQTTNEGVISTKHEEIAKIEEEIFDLQKQINMLEAENIDIDLDTVEIDTIQRQLNKLHELHFKISHNKSDAEKNLDFFHDNNICPTCTQTIEKEFKDRKISDLRGKTLQYVDALGEMKEQLEQLDNQFTLLQERKDVKKVNASKVFHLSNIIKRNENSIFNLKEEINRLCDSPDIAKMQGKLEVYQEEYSKTEQRCAEVSKQKSEYDVVSSLLKDSGIKARVIKKYIPVINNRINRHLTSMDFYVNFTLDEEFNEVIKSRYRDVFSYSSFSEGEKQKIDLALLFTWREIAHMKNSVSTNLLLLDEVFDSSLDASATEDLLKILKSIDKDTNVFVISHKGEILTDKFHTNIKFEKVSDFSKIVSSADNDI